MGRFKEESIFNFFCGTKIIFGVKSRESIGEIIKKESWQHVGLVIDGNVLKTGRVNRWIDRLAKQVKKLTLASCEMAEPTYEYLESLRLAFKAKKINAVIGVGGGSALDAAKAMAVFINNHGPAISYKGYNKFTRPPVPIIAIPTTAGTGSEVTPNASFVDGLTKKKMGINGEGIRPKYALLDPELTISCPKRAAISAGLDSMVHAVEAYTARKSNYISQIFSREGFCNVFFNLSAVLKNPEDMNASSKVMLGALLSGIALMNSGAGPATAMSYPLSVYYKVPHGLGGGIFLPQVIKYNISQGCECYSEFLKFSCQAGNRTAQAKRFIGMIDKFWDELNVPKDLRVLGVNKSDLPLFVNDILELKGALEQNPFSFGQKQIKGILGKLGV